MNAGQSQPLPRIYRTISRELRDFHPHRSELLFTEFLPRGYALTALTPRKGKIPPAVRRQATLTKLLLASLITFQDDLADHPKHRNANILRYLYRHLSIAGAGRDFPFSSGELELIHFSTSILNQLLIQAQKLPAYEYYSDLFAFDLDQFHNANRYGGLLAAYPGMTNGTEQAHFTPFNMGMTAAATIDLMTFDINAIRVPAAEFGRIREASYLGQRAGRISNVLATFERELKEGDVTNDAVNLIMTGHYDSSEEARRDLLKQHDDLTNRIEALDSDSGVINLSRYADGIRNLHRLHMSLEGTI